VVVLSITFIYIVLYTIHYMFIVACWVKFQLLWFCVLESSMRKMFFSMWLLLYLYLISCCLIVWDW